MVAFTDIYVYLISHPVLFAIVAVIVISLVVSIVKKLLKAAVVLLVILLLAGGAVYHAASDAVKTQSERLLDDVKQKLDIH